MGFHERHIVVSLVNFSLILVYFTFRIFQMVQTDTFYPANVYSLWVLTIILGILVIILGTILTHIVFAIIEAIQTGAEPVEPKTTEDERDRLIDLKGTKISYAVYSIGTFIAMITMVAGKPPLVMFTLMIASGLVAQVIGDIARLRMYRSGVGHG